MDDPASRMPARAAGRGFRCPLAVLALALAAAACPFGSASAEEWRGLVVAPEHRCSPYDGDLYPYPQSVEAKIVAAFGGRVYGPYTGRSFASMRQTDIEHIVARSEAHDSGLCAAGAALRRRFASDPLNLALASPRVNRCSRSGKCGKDAAEWMPPMNRCWFAARVVEVRRKYALTIDRREADALERTLSACDSTAMVILDRGIEPASDAPSGAAAEPARDDGALGLWDDDRNGRITCREARRHGIAPVPRGHPAYPFMRDGDGDGTVCE